jgi:hypothetical protein
VLAGLRDVPGVEVIPDPQPTFVLEALASGLRQIVDVPLVWGVEISDKLVICEELDGLFAHGSCCEGQTDALFLLIEMGSWLKGCLDFQELMVLMWIILADEPWSSWLLDGQSYFMRLEVALYDVVENWKVNNRCTDEFYVLTRFLTESTRAS